MRNRERVKLHNFEILKLRTQFRDAKLSLAKMNSDENVLKSRKVKLRNAKAKVVKVIEAKCELRNRFNETLKL